MICFAMSDPNTNPTSCLQERYQTSGILPEYTVLRVEGEDHVPLFEANVEVAEGLVARGSGPSKKAARSQAATNMLTMLRNEGKMYPRIYGANNNNKSKLVGGSILAMDLRSLLRNPKHADFTFKCRGKSYSCHKAILISRSPVFDKMISSGSKLLNKVEIKEFKAETLECVLEYIYTGDVKREIEDMAELIMAGLQFQLVGLAEVGFNKFESDMKRGMNAIRKALRRTNDNQEGVTVQDNKYMEKLHHLQMMVKELSISEE